MELTITGNDVNVELLDQVGLSFQNGDNPQLSQNEANVIIIQFTERIDAYQYVTKIISQSKVLYIKFTALAVLCLAVKRRWNTLSDLEKQNIGTFVFEYLKSVCTNSTISETEVSNLSMKCNQIIIEIAKYDYPMRWPNLFDIFLQNLSISRSYFLNFLHFIANFAMDLTTDSEFSVTSLRATEMKNAFSLNFPTIFEILRKSVGDDIEISRAAIRAMKKIIYINDADQILFNSPWLNELIQVYLPRPELSVAVIGLLTGLITRPVDISINSQNTNFNATYNLVLGLFNTVVAALHQAVGDDFSYTSKLSGDDSFEQSFVSAISLFFTHYSMVFKEESFSPQIQQILTWVLAITIVADPDRFETCIEFWLGFLRRLYTETKNALLTLSDQYLALLHKLRTILIERMPSPIFVVNYIEIDGSPHKRISNNTNFGTFYSTARQCMVFLANFDPEDTTRVILERLEELITVNSNIEAVQSLCWAIGSIPGASPPHEELFLPKMLANIFQLCNGQPKLQDKASIAEGIVFVCSQYSKFVSRFYSLFKSIVMKMIEFMSLREANLQEFTLEALKSLAQNCQKSFLELPSLQQQQQSPQQQQQLLQQQIQDIGVEEISILQYFLQNLDSIISPLVPDNIPTMYEILGILVSGIQNDEMKIPIATQLINDLISKFGQLLGNFDQSNFDLVRTMIVVLRCHSTMPNYFGSLYFILIQPILPELMDFYVILTSSICNSSDGAPLFRQLKSEILISIQRAIFFFRPADINKMQVPMLIECKSKIINDYALNPKARVPEVLVLFSTLIVRLCEQMTPFFTDIFTKLYSTTYEMIQDQINFGDFMLPFFRFVNSFCIVFIKIISELEAQQADFIIETLIYGAGCMNSDVRDQCSCTILELFGKMKGNQQNHTFFEFLQKYSIPILLRGLEHIFDLSMKSSFQANTNLVRFFMNLPFVMDQAGVVANELCGIIPNKLQEEVFQMTEQLFRAAQDFASFRPLIKDILVSARQISINDPDLNTFEKSEMIKELNMKFRSIPGYLTEEGDAGDSLSRLPATFNDLSISS